MKYQKTTYPGVVYIEVARPTGGTEKSYYVFYREPSTGKLRNVSVGRQYRDDMTPARASLIRGEYIEGRRIPRKDKKTEEAARPTVAKLWEAYCTTLKNKKTLASDQCNYNRLGDKFTDKTVSKITTGEVDTVRDRLLDSGLAPQTVKHTLGLLRRIIHNSRLIFLPHRKIFQYDVSNCYECRHNGLINLEFRKNNS